MRLGLNSLQTTIVAAKAVKNIFQVKQFNK